MQAVRAMRRRSASVFSGVMVKKVGTAASGLMMANSDPALISAKFSISIPLVYKFSVPAAAFSGWLKSV